MRLKAEHLVQMTSTVAVMRMIETEEEEFLFPVLAKYPPSTSSGTPHLFYNYEEGLVA